VVTLVTVTDDGSPSGFYAGRVMLHLVGYWRNEQHPEFPDPHKMVDRNWDPEEQATLASYFATGTFLRAGMGYSPCRICEQNNGASEYTDGVLVWPEGLTHYIEDHWVRPPQVVVQYALDQVNRLDDESVSLNWWISGCTEPPPS
jgi:hypothetical protein